MTTTTDPALRRGKLRAFAVVIALLLLIMLAYIARRLSVDVPNVLAGTVPDDEYERRYVEHPWLAYAHIAPGLVYLLGVPLQMAYRFRSRHYDVHRRTGRVLLTAGLFSGAFAIAFGVLYPFGGPVEAAAAVVFGIWFLFCLVSAFRAIKRDDVVAHRRWMIRAFAVGVAVGTIRIWVVLFQVFGLLDFDASFGPAFWISFWLHTLVAEWWVRSTPHPPG